MTIEHTHPGTPPIDDPQIEEAMRVYDEDLNDDERREVFRTMYRAVTAYRRRSDIDHLVRFAESIEGMVRFQSDPEFRDALRAQRQTPRADEGSNLGEVIKRLRE